MIKRPKTPNKNLVEAELLVSSSTVRMLCPARVEVCIRPDGVGAAASRMEYCHESAKFLIPTTTPISRTRSLTRDSTNSRTHRGSLYM